MVESFEKPAAVGFRATCGDLKKRVLYPNVAALTLDTEEAWMVTLTLGVRSNNGVCPRCKVPHDKLCDTRTWPFRTVQESRAAVERAAELQETYGNIGRAAQLLKEEGIYGVFVRILTLQNPDSQV